MPRSHQEPSVRREGHAVERLPPEIFLLWLARTEARRLPRPGAPDSIAADRARDEPLPVRREDCGITRIRQRLLFFPRLGAPEPHVGFVAAGQQLAIR